MSKTIYPRKPRPKTRAELITRIEQVWNEMVSTWQGLPEEALTRPGACGPTWSIKDVMNHNAAWHEAALRVIPELMLGRKAAAGHSTDKFNAIHHEMDANRPLAETNKRFNDSRQQLLRLIETLPDELILDPNCRVGWWIKYSTYGHYSGHIHDLNVFRESILKSG